MSCPRLRFCACVVMTLALFAALFATGPAVAQRAATSAERIADHQASRHVGEVAMVCGYVAGGYYAVSAQGQPTFLDFGQGFPGEVFRVVIWGAERSKFKEPPEQSYNRRQVCVTGKIQLERGKPEIVVKDPAQLVLDQLYMDPE